MWLSQSAGPVPQNRCSYSLSQPAPIICARYYAHVQKTLQFSNPLPFGALPLYPRQPPLGQWAPRLQSCKPTIKIETSSYIRAGSLSSSCALRKRSTLSIRVSWEGLALLRLRKEDWPTSGRFPYARTALGNRTGKHAQGSITAKCCTESIRISPSIRAPRALSTPGSSLGLGRGRTWHPPQLLPGLLRKGASGQKFPRPALHSTRSFQPLLLASRSVLQQNVAQKC